MMFTLIAVNDIPATDDGSPKTPRKRKAKAMDEETEEKSPKKKVLKEGDTMQFVPEGKLISVALCDSSLLMNFCRSLFPYH